MRLIIFLIAFVLSSCKENRPAATFTKQIYSKDSSALTYKHHYETKMQIPSLENGLDSFEMRLWEEESFSYGLDMYRIQFKNDRWSFQKYFVMDRAFSQGLPDSISFAAETVKAFKDYNIPLNGRYFDTSKAILLDSNKFLNLLKKYQLINFPTQKSLKGLDGGCTDGVMFTVELGTKDIYRLISYNNPSCHTDNLERNNLFEEFILEFKSLIQDEDQKWPLALHMN